MAFAVYVNYPSSRATVHSTDCHVYRNRRAERTDNGHWRKHFSCLEDAQAYASGTGGKVGACAFCLGEIAQKKNKLMPDIVISEEMYARVMEFKQVVEAVIKEEISFDVCVELILGQGINSMLADLLGSVDPITLLSSFQQLGSQYPAQVYRYVAETLRQGAATREQEEMRKRLGFRTPADADSEA